MILTKLAQGFRPICLAAELEWSMILPRKSWLNTEFRLQPMAHFPTLRKPKPIEKAGSVKADGLALGKGVVVADREQAVSSSRYALDNKSRTACARGRRRIPIVSEFSLLPLSMATSFTSCRRPRTISVPTMDGGPIWRHGSLCASASPATKRG